MPFVGPLGIARALAVTVSVTDPDVLQAVEAVPEGPERQAFLAQALRIGVLAIGQAGGRLDVEAMRREGEHLLTTLNTALATQSERMAQGLTEGLGKFLDPTHGSFQARLQKLTGQGGELDALLARHVGGETSTLASALSQQVGRDSPLFKLLSPEQAGGLFDRLNTLVEVQLQKQRDHVLREFSLDRDDSALSRLLASLRTANHELQSGVTGDLSKALGELSLDKEDSALNRMRRILEETSKTVSTSLTLDQEGSALALLRRELLEHVGTLATNQQNLEGYLRSAIAELQTRKAEAARTPLHGGEFEDEVGAFVRRDADAQGDFFEATGKTTGRASNRKVGDFVVTLGAESAGASARIVVEAKARDRFTEGRALEELSLARKVRGAAVGVLVLAKDHAPEGGRLLRRFGQDVVVVWDARDPASDVVLQAALSLARCLAVRAASAAASAEVDVREALDAADEIEKLVARAEGLRKTGEGTVRNGQNVIAVAEEILQKLPRELERIRRVARQVGGADLGKGDVDPSQLTLPEAAP